MKRSDYVIITVGIIVAVAFFAALAWFALSVNTANAGLHFTF